VRPAPNIFAVPHSSNLWKKCSCSPSKRPIFGRHRHTNTSKKAPLVTTQLFCLKRERHNFAFDPMVKTDENHFSQLFKREGSLLLRKRLLKCCGRTYSFGQIRQRPPVTGHLFPIKITDEDFLLKQAHVYY